MSWGLWIIAICCVVAGGALGLLSALESGRRQAIDRDKPSTAKSKRFSWYSTRRGERN